MGPVGKTCVAAGLVCSALAIGLAPAAAAVEDKTIVADTAGVAADEPTTLREAVEQMARHFDFAVIGANRLGTDAPTWPEEELAPEAMLGSLLKDYSYIVLLKPESGASTPREPGTLLIVGLNHPPPADTTKPATARTPIMASAEAAAPMPVSRAPSWAPRPSTVVRALTKLATTSSGQPGSAGDQSTQPAAPMPNPAENTAAMAALTHSAQAGLGALVTGLRQACPNPKGC